MGSSKKIFVGNYKGGVGKTTSIYQIALHMVDYGKKVLLIDLDPQCSLSEICLERKELLLQQLQSEECLNYLYDLWNENKKIPQLKLTLNKSKLIKSTKEGIDFIPSNIFYTNGGLDEIALTLENKLEDLIVLQQFFQSSKMEEDYDFILFDCPPSNNVITQGAFLLSDYYIILPLFKLCPFVGLFIILKQLSKTITNIV